MTMVLTYSYSCVCVYYFWASIFVPLDHICVTLYSIYVFHPSDQREKDPDLGHSIVTPSDFILTFLATSKSSGCIVP
jgi:hypothetical protein